MDDEDTKIGIICELPEVQAVTSVDLLPEKSKKLYESVFNNFHEWCLKNNDFSYSEKNLLKYFKEQSNKYKSSTLWTQFSMLKSTLLSKCNVNIEKYMRLKKFLKEQSKGHNPKQTELFSTEEINKFIDEAPDVKYLATKVALIMGVFGACHTRELHAMKVDNLRFFDGCVQVFVRHSKTKVIRNFTINDRYYDVIKKYAGLRPSHTKTSSFFLNYQNGRCTIQVIGINKFGTMGKEIAKYLGLPNPEKYTGHSFRKSSQTFVNKEISKAAVESHADLESASVSDDTEDDDSKSENPEGGEVTSLELLPEKSKKFYLLAYENFNEWHRKNNLHSYSEDVLMLYFKALSKKYKSSSLWRHYSMLKSTLYIKRKISMEPYARLRALLKELSEGYQARKSSAFTAEDIEKFINEAPDLKYLAIKVALIMGVMGGCQTRELYAMNVEHVKFLDDCAQVFLIHPKTKVPRKFIITDNLHRIVKKYADLRSPNATSNSFFLSYNNGKCMASVMGINHFGTMGKKIAKFLGLPNPERYTGRCFRKSHGALFAKTDNLDLDYDKDSAPDSPSKSGITIFLDTDEEDSKCDINPNLRETLKIKSLDSLPEKTKKLYELVYENFNEWCAKNNAPLYSESTLLAYFKELTQKYKSTTLWTHYSMLKITIYIKSKINIKHFPKLRQLLKKHAEGYQPKKSEAFTAEEIKKFLQNAPDVKYLATKVALIIGVIGACQTRELYAMHVEDVKFFDDHVQVFVPHIKTKIPRTFTITDNLYRIVKKYADLRLPNASSNSFFLNYQSGKCTAHVIGINRFGTMGKEIAQFLGIENPEKYTGHFFRKSSGTLLANVEMNKTISDPQEDSDATSMTEDCRTNSDTDDEEDSKSGIKCIIPQVREATSMEFVDVGASLMPDTDLTAESGTMKEGISGNSDKMVILHSGVDNENIIPPVEPVTSIGCDTAGTNMIKNKDFTENSEVDNEVVEIQLVTLSQNLYLGAYEHFNEWRLTNNIVSCSETILLPYFGELANKYTSSTLWRHYSMLKTTLSEKSNVNIETYTKIQEFLDKQSEGSQRNKSELLTAEEINKFIMRASDVEHLVAKVALIMGIMGACNANQLHAMKMEHVGFIDGRIKAFVPHTKTKAARFFSITENFYLIVKKYADLRHPLAKSNSFFLNYLNGKCTVQVMDVSKFETMGREIAEFLGKPNPERYTSFCFQQSSSTLFANTEVSETTLEFQEDFESASQIECFSTNSDTDNEDSKSDINCILPESSGVASMEFVDTRTMSSTANSDMEDELLPEKSKKMYLGEFDNFNKWCKKNNFDSQSEHTLLVYFKELAQKYKASTLWKCYSMLKNALYIKCNVNIQSYRTVLAFLKLQSKGYTPNKSNAFTAEQINKFINNAPDFEYLATKVVLIMGVMGGCNSNELHGLKVGHVQVLDGSIQVFVPHTRNKIPKNFTITGNWYHIVKKYVDLRNPYAESDSFFLSYRKGKCNFQVIGINKFGIMVREIAQFLGIPNPEKYTGHCFRQTSGTLNNVEIGQANLEPNEDWQLISSNEGNIENLDMDDDDKSKIQCLPLESPEENSLEFVDAGPPINTIKSEEDWEISSMGEGYIVNSDTDDDDTNSTLPEPREVTSLELLPDQTRKAYLRTFDLLNEWCAKNNVTSYSEDNLLVYFKEMAVKYKSSTLYRNYYVLKTTLHVKCNLNIEPYVRLRQFLKDHSEGYQPTKCSEAFTPEEVNKFINEAPDVDYLATKVALIFGVMGSCHVLELHDLKVEDLRFFNGCIQVFVMSRKTKTVRNFTITDRLYHIVKKYADLRLPNKKTKSFFLKYKNGKCAAQVIGRTKFAAMGKEIAEFLELPNSEKYNGHCFRKSYGALRTNMETSKSPVQAQENREVTMNENFIVDSDSEEYDSKSDIQCTLTKIQGGVSEEYLPEKSKKFYLLEYDNFIEWRLKNKLDSYSEDVVLKYFNELATRYSSSTLWRVYSMLKITLSYKCSVHIETYSRLRAFLKQYSKGHQPTTSESFTANEIYKFIKKAPDVKYLAIKVALIMGVMGACSRKELHDMKVKNVRFFDGCAHVVVPHKRTPRNFTITDDFYTIVKKYADLRCRGTTADSFFLSYREGRCTGQVIGINKFGTMGREIAEFLDVPNPEKYTGLALRKSYGALFTKSKTNMKKLKRKKDLELSPEVEGYNANSKLRKINPKSSKS